MQRFPGISKIRAGNSNVPIYCMIRADRAVSHLVAVVVVAEVDGGGNPGGGAVRVSPRVARVADGDLVAAVVVVPLPVVGLVGGRLADRHEGVGRRRRQLRRDAQNLSTKAISLCDLVLVHVYLPAKFCACGWGMPLRRASVPISS